MPRPLGPAIYLSAHLWSIITVSELLIAGFADNYTNSKDICEGAAILVIKGTLQCSVCSHWIMTESEGMYRPVVPLIRNDEGNRMLM